MTLKNELSKKISESQIKEKEDSFKNNILKDKEITSSVQNKIILIESLATIRFFLTTDNHYQNEIFDTISFWFEEYSIYLDSNENEFIEGCLTNFSSRIFELFIANLITKEKLQIPTSNNNPRKKKRPDDKYDFLTEDFFIECTSVNTSFITDWCNLLPKFDIYYKFFKEISKGKNSLLNYLIENIHPDELSNISKQLEIEETLSREEKIKIFKKWLFLNSFVKHYHPKLIPDNYFKKISKLNNSEYHENSPKDYIFISKRIIKKLIEKIQKKYFQQQPGILAISVAFVVQGLQLSLNETEELVVCFVDNYQKFLTEELNKCSAENQQKISKGLNNLIAIILDTNWYNWFFSVLKKYEVLTIKNQEQKNFLYLLRGDKLSEEWLLHFKKNIHYHQDLNLNPINLEDNSLSILEKKEEAL